MLVAFVFVSREEGRGTVRSGSCGWLSILVTELKLNQTWLSTEQIRAIVVRVNSLYAIEKYNSSPMCH